MSCAECNSDLKVFILKGTSCFLVLIVVIIFERGSKSAVSFYLQRRSEEWNPFLF